MASLPSGRAAWPHAPPHWLFDPGLYFVTAATYHRERLFVTPEALETVTCLLIDTAKEHGWTLRAWAVLANHYHLLAASPSATGESLREWLTAFHRDSAVGVNRLAETPGRRVWMNFRETRITHQTSYLARLRYVNENPVRHGLVRSAVMYRWCSAAWFQSKAPRSFVASVGRFGIDRLNVWDDFDAPPATE